MYGKYFLHLPEVIALCLKKHGGLPQTYVWDYMCISYVYEER